jgi:uncharacterized protein YkwD
MNPWGPDTGLPQGSRMAVLRCYACLAAFFLTGGMLARASGAAAESVKMDAAGLARAASETAPKLTASDAAAPVASASSREDNLTQLEKQLWVLINQERLNPANQVETGGKALPLKWNEKLAAVARAYSEDMLRRGFYAHVNPEVQTPAMRVAVAGIPWQAESENIAVDASVAGAQAAFMDEPPFAHNHRSNILSAKFTDVGVGIVRAPDGTYYITQEFVKTPTDEFVAAQSLSFGSRTGRSAPGGR